MDINELFHSIVIKRKKYFSDLINNSDLTMLQIEILVFLEKYPTSNTFTEIMKSNDYAKSHISSAINGLVSNGYIRKEVSTTNKKIQNLFLLEKSTPLISHYLQLEKEYQDIVCQGISDEEFLQFKNVLIKIEKNLGE